jgi:hypothetical protein
MSTHSFSRILKISVAVCLALVLASDIAGAGQYGPSYSHNHHYQPSHNGYGQRSYVPPQHNDYYRPPQHCRPHYQPQPHSGYQNRYR